MTQKPVNLHEFEAIAKEKLPEMAFHYYSSGADAEETLSDNRAAYNRIRLRPRYMRGVEQIDTSTTVLGHTIPYPILVAPMAYMAMAHPDGEFAMARATAKHNIPMILSTMSTYSLERINAIADGLKFFQLYVYKDKSVTEALIRRAEKSGYKAIVLTVDAPQLGRRRASLYSGKSFTGSLTPANLLGEEMQAVIPHILTSEFAANIDVQRDANLSWEHLKWFKSITNLPIIAKGFLRADDVNLAIKHGIDGIIVSNHGGRQLDTAPATIDVLADITDVVDERVDVLVDGGIRRGTDIIKALALGAKAVLIGRPMMYALAYNGEAGVNHAIDLITSEFDTAMRLCGCRNLSEITPDLLMY